MKKLIPMTLVFVCFLTSIIFFKVNPHHLILLYLPVIFVYLTTVLILSKHEPGQFHLDKCSVLALIVLAFVRTNLGVPNETLWLAVVRVLGGALLITTIYRWRAIPATNLRWSARSITITYLTLMPLTFVEMKSDYLPAIPVEDLRYGFGLFVGRAALRNLSFVTPMEEILFRGFLWGYLRQLRWPEKDIALSQAALFLLLHANYLPSYPYTFFVTITIGTALFTMLAYYSHQVFPSIIAHTIINAFLQIAVHIARSL